MPPESSRPVLNTILKFTKDPRPEGVTAGGKNVKSIKNDRLEAQRQRLATDLRGLAETAINKPKFNGRSVIYASMFDDSLAPSWTPRDLFSRERGARLIAPYRTGYLIEMEVAALANLGSVVRSADRISDRVDISRVRSVRFFDEDDVTGTYDLDEAWEHAPQSKDGRVFLMWLMPLRDRVGAEEILNTVEGQRREGNISSAPLVLPRPSRDDPASLRRELQVLAGTDRLKLAMRTFRQTRRATATVVIPSRRALTKLVASGVVFRIEPVRTISSTSPGEGKEPNRPLPAQMSNLPIVGVVDGGLTAQSYLGAEAWRAPSFVADADADNVHGNRITSLVVQGHDWNNNLTLPSLYCQVGTVQAVPRRGSARLVDEQGLILYLDAVMGAYPSTKVWNMSFNVAEACDPEAVSYLGHQLSLLARKHNVLPIISVGNKPGELLQPPADCEAAITVGGRLHNADGLPGGACPISLIGPGPSSMLKPDLSHFSHVRVLGGVETRGSSFSTALTSPLAAHTMERLRERAPDLAKALMLHCTDGKRGFDRSCGFGSPAAHYPWQAPPGFVTLQWSAALRPGAAYYWDLPIPYSLRKTGKLKGSGRLTAVLNPHPLVSEIAGPNYFSARIETALQYSRSDKAHNLLGSLETGKLTEDQARAIDHKWSPVRHHAKPFRGVSFDDESFQVYARTYVRDLYLYPYASADEVPEMTAYFVLSLGTGDEDDDIFNQLREELGASFAKSLAHMLKTRSWRWTSILRHDLSWHDVAWLSSVSRQGWKQSAMRSADPPPMQSPAPTSSSAPAETTRGSRRPR
jgi:hypothetical protein